LTRLVDHALSDSDADHQTDTEHNRRREIALHRFLPFLDTSLDFLLRTVTFTFRVPPVFALNSV
jgi:hypothetical protein